MHLFHYAWQQLHSSHLIEVTVGAYTLAEGYVEVERSHNDTKLQKISLHSNNAHIFDYLCPQINKIFNAYEEY